MRRSAGKDEYSKQNVRPAERQIPPGANQKYQHGRNQKVGKGNQPVRDRMQRNDYRFTQAIDMRCEIGAGKNFWNGISGPAAFSGHSHGENLLSGQKIAHHFQ
jgi:hypothetical protein